jgi:hypothetical protein
MGRIFTFGCSFTNYAWPTWADIILKKNEGFNLGICGGGYDMLLYRILETDRTYKFTKEDRIIVIFTTPNRWDTIIGSYEHPRWGSHGAVLNSLNSKYLNKLYCIDGLQHNSFYNMWLINDYLKNKNLNYLLGSLDQVFNSNEKKLVNEDTVKLIEYVQESVNLDLKDFFSYLNYSFNGETNKTWGNQMDYHPRPTQHFNWVKDILLPKLDINLKVTEDEILEIENFLDGFNNLLDFENEATKKFPDFYEHRLNNKVYMTNKTKLT